MSCAEIVDSYKNFRLSSYRSIFERIRGRDGSLSATEAYAVDVIYLLGEPTIKQFSDFLGISQPNATYKINSLISKGYVTKEPSETDRRESRLRVSEKFHRYYDQAEAEIQGAADNLERRFSTEEMGVFRRILRALNEAVK